MKRRTYDEYKKIEIVKFLREHGRTPIHSRELEKQLRLDSAYVRSCINDARCEGIPICSNIHGYFYSEEAYDIIATIKHLEGRMAKQKAAIDGLATNVKGD